MARRWGFVGLCLAAGALFFSSLGDLWPLARMRLLIDEEASAAQAVAFLESRGFDVDQFVSSAWLSLDDDALRYVEQAFGHEATQSWIASGAPLLRHRVHLKRSGDTTTFTVDLHPEVGVLGFTRHLEEDAPGAKIESDAARRLAEEFLLEGLNLALDAYELRSAAATERPARRDHGFWFERLIRETPELRERLRIRVAGDVVVSAYRSWTVPAEARRAARSAEASGQAMEIIGFGLLAITAVGAFVVFLTRMQRGEIDLREAAIWPCAVFICLMATYSLQSSDLLRAWEPLWPRWISSLRFVVFRSMEQIWIVLLLLAVVAAGFALDRETRAGRGASLAALGRGRLLDPGVARASRRGFLVGLLCGGVMAGTVLLLTRFVGAETAIQPRGFFFYPLNSDVPALTSLLFFFGVALAEELGYRFFAGGWLMALTGRKWLAVILPAVIYGLTHTRLDFLPPAGPEWSRALVLTLVGCVWGWAFLRFDALTVVLSHFTADLFIFNWPSLASGKPEAMALSVLACLVPLLPAALGLLRPWLGFVRSPRASG